MKISELLDGLTKVMVVYGDIEVMVQGDDAWVGEIMDLDPILAEPIEEMVCLIITD